jgi:hypothetical protein
MFLTEHGLYFPLLFSLPALECVLGVSAFRSTERKGPAMGLLILGFAFGSWCWWGALGSGASVDLAELLLATNRKAKRLIR